MSVRQFRRKRERFEERSGSDVLGLFTRLINQHISSVPSHPKAIRHDIHLPGYEHGRDAKIVTTSRVYEISQELWQSVSYSLPGEDVKDDPFEQQKAEFQRKLPELIKNESYRGKYVAMVNGVVAGVDTDKIRLAETVYARRGRVTMYIGLVADRPRVYIDTSEFD